jgi:hypothetical protein
MWYRGFGCSTDSHDDKPMKLDARAGAVMLPHLGEDDNKYGSVECKGEDW